MIFAFLLLQLVHYNVEGKHFLVETNGKHLLVETKDEKNIIGRGPLRTHARQDSAALDVQLGRYKGRNGSDYTAEAFSEGKKGEECSFSRDCRKIERCSYKARKDCRCFFGKCFAYTYDQDEEEDEEEDYDNESQEASTQSAALKKGLLSGKPPLLHECDTYKDCSCKSDPKNCFCDIYSNKYGRSVHKCVTAPLRHECDTYKDCSCKSDPKNCFCDIFSNKYGRSVHKCVTDARECHQTSDCAAMKKCKGRECRCEQDACEWECNEAKDCENKEHFCHERATDDPRWTCECREMYQGAASVCLTEEKVVKCNKVKDCEDKKHHCQTDADSFCKCEDGECRSLESDPDPFEEEVTCKETKECEKLCNTDYYSDYTDDYTCKCETGNCVMVPKAIV